MDPSVLATSVVTDFLVPFLQDGARKLGGETAGRLWERVRSLFAEPDDRQVVELFEKRPERFRAIVTDMLRERLAADASLRAELEGLVAPPASSSGARIEHAGNAVVIDNRGADIGGSSTIIGQVFQSPPVDEPAGPSA